MANIHYVTDDPQLTMMLDNTGSPVMYIGQAVPGTATSASTWRIKKVDLTTPNVVITWANGISTFQNVWDNRASYTYS